MLPLVVILLQSLNSPFFSVAVIDGHTYALGREEVNWFEAVVTCAANNMKLAIIADPDDEKNLQNYIENFMQLRFVLGNLEIDSLFEEIVKREKMSYWLGATNLAQSNSYSWFDTASPLSSTQWNNNNNVPESAITWQLNGKWQQDHYQAKHGFICEVAPSVTPYANV